MLLFWEAVDIDGVGSGGGTGNRVQVHPFNIFDVGNYTTGQGRIIAQTPDIQQLNRYSILNYNFERDNNSSTADQSIVRNGQEEGSVKGNHSMLSKDVARMVI